MQKIIFFLRNSVVGDTYTIIGMYEGKYNLDLPIDKQKLRLSDILITDTMSSLKFVIYEKE